MAIEIERKFLVSGEGWREHVSGVRRIRQAYLSQGGNANVRVRIVDEAEARLTIKSCGAALSREEYEYPLPLDDALAMFELRAGVLIEKVRHLVPAEGGRTWEVDVFEGAHHGLVMAEIELAHAEEAFALPEWLGREVTGEAAYGNSALARAGLAKAE